jgi:hypothetical protein
MKQLECIHAVVASTPSYFRPDWVRFICFLPIIKRHRTGNTKPTGEITSRTGIRTPSRQSDTVEQPRIFSINKKQIEYDEWKNQ